MIKSRDLTSDNSLGVARGGGGAGSPGSPNWNATNDKNVSKKTIVSSVSVSFSIFVYNSTNVQQ